MRTRCTIVFLSLLGCGFFGSVSIAGAVDFTIADVDSARKADVAQLKSGIIEFSDHTGAGAINSETALVSFSDWADKYPQRKEISWRCFRATWKPRLTKPRTAPSVNRAKKSPNGFLSTWRRRAFFSIAPPGAIDLPHYVTLPFLEKIDPAIKHKELAPADALSLKDDAGTGNDNPDRKWCTGRTTLICIQSVYKL